MKRFSSVILLVCVTAVVMAESVDYKVPMVHQRWDTPDNFAGGWACGPTSAVMALAYFGKLHPHPINCSSPTHHTNDYGWYVATEYKTVTGHLMNRYQKDAAGRMAAGAYGWCTDGGGAWAYRVADYAVKNGLASRFVQEASFANIKAALKAHKIVVLSTQLTSAGHLINVHGFDDNGNTLIVNDPYGNRFEPGYGTKTNGHNLRYKYADVHAKWMVEIWSGANVNKLNLAELTKMHLAVEYTQN